MAIYVDNKKFSQALYDYRTECELRESQGLEHKEIPRFIAECFLDIAKHYSTKHSFARYSFREDMVSEAVISCCSKVLKYDATASPYAFTYFSRICFHVFLDVIYREKKESYVKAKLFAQNPDDGFESDESELGGDHTGDNIGQDFIPYFDVNDFEQKIEVKKQEAKAKKVAREQVESKPSLEDFITPES